MVADLVSSLVQAGFGRIVLVPAHGGNFAPLAEAVEKLPESERRHVVAITDLSVFIRVAELGEREFEVPMAQGGLHAGEWETSMLLAIHPELVHMDRAEAGYVGDPQEAIAGLFEGGVDSLSKVGAIGDPAQASAEHGRRYWEAVLDLAVELVEAETPLALSGPAASPSARSSRASGGSTGGTPPRARRAARARSWS